MKPGKMIFTKSKLLSNVKKFWDHSSLCWLPVGCTGRSKGAWLQKQHNADWNASQKLVRTHPHPQDGHTGDPGFSEECLKSNADFSS